MRSQVEVHAQVVVELVEFLADPLTHRAHLAVLPVVLQAVLKHKVQIVEEVLELQVLVRVQLLLYRAEVHRLIDDVVVVRDVELLGVHWLVEDPSLVVLPDRLDHTLSRLVPAFIDGLGLIDLGEDKLLDRGGRLLHFLCGTEVLSEVGVFCAELGPLVIAERLVLPILQYLKLEPAGIQTLVRPLLGRRGRSCNWCYRRLLLIILAKSILLGYRVVLLEELDNGRLIGFLGELERCLVPVVDIRGVDPTLKQVLHDISPVALDCIVQRGLFVVIDQIWVTSVGHKLLNDLQVAFSGGVKDRRLTVGVDIVHVAVSLSDKVVNQV